MMNQKIPKIIHYCWFGGNPLPELAQKCIASWKKYCPEYEIREWNESNFDLNCCDYVREAYEAKKWAFVSDYARFWILYHKGGIYFDTDVEIIKPLNEILKQGGFLGCETLYTVAPGLGMAANPGLVIYKEMLDFYEKRHFRNQNGAIDTTTIVTYTTQILMQHGWKPEREIQTVEGITIYPPEYFCPMNYKSGELNITKNTRTIHHYAASWYGKTDKQIATINKKCIERFGVNVGQKVSAILVLPVRLKRKLEYKGIIKSKNH